jgi:acyl-CoA thioester hydrolase
MASSQTQIRVRYADTDQMRVVHHARFLEYFELGRSDLIRNLGMSYGELEARGIFLPVVEAFAKYRRPALYDELITVESTIAEVPKVSLRIDYKITREGEADILAEGYTVHGFLNAATNKPTRAPAFFIEMIEKGLSSKLP